MTAIQSAILDERWLDEVLLGATGLADSAGADTVDTIILPEGIGDVALMEFGIYVSPIATMHANPQNLGGVAFITNTGGGTFIDIVGQIEWRASAATRIWGYCSPDPLVLWRQHERLQLEYPELDTNAVPTGDVLYRIKVVRVRPQVDTHGAPLRLVR